MNKEFTCIVCPKGCKIKVKGDEITGYTCLRGLNYVKQEITLPKRTITSTVKVSNRDIMCPCKTSGDIDKKLIFDVMKEINKAKINAPIKINDVIIKNVLNTNIDILSTKNID